MNESVLVDPTSETTSQQLALAPRPASLEGRRVGLLDISKPGGSVFLDRVEQLLRSRDVAVERLRKPTFTRPAPPDLRREIAERCDLVIEALAD
jgi:hypothetical protein